MRPLALSQIARWCDARLVGDDLVVQAIGIDTRTLVPGSVYVALRGESFDGHDFCAQAEASGARALLVEHVVESALPQIVCTDSRIALARIAAELAAGRSTCTIGITGSNGKTTTRTLTLGILRCVESAAYSNPGNRNNEVGLPLALIEQPEHARFGVYEMGAGAPGDISYLANIVRPKIALVTNIAPAHLERLGSLAGVAETKGAIYDGLSGDGVAVINADDAFAPFFVNRIGTRCRIVRYGLDATAEVWADAIVEEDAGSRFRLHSPCGSADVSLPLSGRHQVSNALAAATLALVAGVSLENVTHGLARAEGVAGRQQALTLSDGVMLLDDSYNANPGSVATAVATLVRQALRRGVPAWLALGDMRELGPGAAVLHADVGRSAKEAGVARLFAVGPMSRHAAVAFGPGGEHFPDQESLVERLKGQMDEPVVLLVKGSRGSRMDRIVAALLNGAVQEGNHAA
ncbi:UDP-N-acetylmuramoyl-tripeptide--D-alanyl-D-alanine ligase [Xanthomonadaceae bacterium JHOS43]|nr:UDP-N-acetylmuramoyl-tripeptide--D-alanyl-D-alanine ligase [Xanthomonadaceae bacterium JHOS43]